MYNVLHDGIGFVELVDSMGTDLDVVNSARVSYGGNSGKFEEKDRRLIRYLLKNNHTSPLEHVAFKFNVKVPLMIERQWNRHRTWKYFSLNEVSRRYTSSNLEFYIPREFRKQSADNKQMSTDESLSSDDAKQIRISILRQNNNQIALYNDMIEKGVAREIARGVLSQFMYVNFYATVDLHNLLWFLELRRHPHAQWEIQQYAVAIETVIKEKVPVTYDIWNDLVENKYK